MVSVDIFEFKSLELLRTRVLGVGSYGQVCEAQCDDLLCAAKIIHPTLLGSAPFQLHDTNPRLPLNRFMKECALLKEIRHPNIVQYLGTWSDPETQLPVLLMELLDQNLTTLLKNSIEPIPYYIQVNLSLDIVRGLSFLHANSLIHRDLSSNNILLVGNSRAKLSDFGMIKMDSSSSHTNCPGTLVYMPPEAICIHMRYSSKSDVFSFGVLIVQILTRKYPNPGYQFKVVKTTDPNFRSGKVEIRVPEVERRESHIKLVFPGHPLLSISCHCLRDEEEERPTASALCQRVSKLKSSVQYKESYTTNHLALTTLPVVNSHSKLELVDLVSAKDGQIEHLKEELELARLSRESAIESLEQKITERDQLLEAKETALAVKEEVLEQLRLLVEELDFKLTLSQPTAPSAHRDTCTSLSIDSIDKQVAPCKLYRGTNSCAVKGNTAYFMPAFQLPWSGRVYALNLHTLEWSNLPDCPCEFAALVVFEDQLTAVGGRSKPSLIKDLLGASTPSNLLHTLPSHEGEWSRVYPSMPTPRTHPVAVATTTSLIVIGGKMIRALSKVEIMDIPSHQWSTASSLPTPQYDAAATVCGNQLYIVGGCVSPSSPLDSIITCSLTDLVQSSCKRTSVQEVWSALSPLPVRCSTPVSLGDRLIVIGGCGDNHKPTPIVRTYNQTAESWEVVSRLRTPRERCFALALPENKLLVAGGYTSVSANSYTDSVEIVSIV